MKGSQKFEIVKKADNIEQVEYTTKSAYNWNIFKLKKKYNSQTLKRAITHQNPFTNNGATKYPRKVLKIENLLIFPTLGAMGKMRKFSIFRTFRGYFVAPLFVNGF